MTGRGHFVVAVLLTIGWFLSGAVAEFVATHPIVFVYGALTALLGVTAAAIYDLNRGRS